MIDQQKEQANKEIWRIVEKLRGHIDPWEFKNYILGFLFYRYISEDFSNWVKKRSRASDDFDYSKEKNDAVWLNEMKEMFIQEKGYFIYPEDVFENIKNLKTNNIEKYRDLNKKIENIFKRIEEDTKLGGAVKNFEDLFSYIDLQDKKLGKEIYQVNQKITEILEEIGKWDLDIEDVNSYSNVYKFLIDKYITNAGRMGAQHFTPTDVSELIVSIVKAGKKGNIKTVYDPTCGSGSLLLKFKDLEEINFYGQEIDDTTFKLCRINMFLHQVPWNMFHIERGDTLEEDKFEDLSFDVVVSNPPFSEKWRSGENSKGEEWFKNDPRFKDVGVLPPASKSDFAFILHCLYHLKNQDPNEMANEDYGMAAIFCFPGILSRGRSELEIRKWLIDNNYVDAVIQLKDNLFYGSHIPPCLLILQKNKKNEDVTFIDATNYFVKSKNRNSLSQGNIETIVRLYKEKQNIEGVVKVVNNNQIKKENYNLMVNGYVFKEEQEEEVDIVEINKEIKETLKEINELEKEINKLIEEI